MLEIFKQFVNVFCYCAGGNQRELARAKNLKKTQDKAKKSDDGLSAAARKQRYLNDDRFLLLHSTKYINFKAGRRSENAFHFSQ